ETFIDEGLPQERKLAKLYENVDPVYDLIPIKPVAHYTMGGIAVDHRSQTSLAGLYACGECANHNVHGANRLGGNSLLEIIVFGREAGKNAASEAKEIGSLSVPSATPCFLDQEFKNTIDFYKYKEKLGNLLYHKVGIVRKTSELEQALGEIETIRSLLGDMGWSDTSQVCNTNKQEFLEFRNILEISEIVVKSALDRKESCGVHYMEGE
ncbi:MAG: FAD-binding protein, partial [Campylobacterales bacterium]|nr:FAD-binding protein [Campylobacterales bacterium]